MFKHGLTELVKFSNVTISELNTNSQKENNSSALHACMLAGACLVSRKKSLGWPGFDTPDGTKQ